MSDLPGSTLERVARAIAWKREKFWIGHDDDDRIAIIDRKWPDYVDDARAAVEALREPSEGMLRAGAEGYGEASVADFEEDAIRMAHTAMIDHILKEG